MDINITVVGMTYPLLLYYAASQESMVELVLHRLENETMERTMQGKQ